MIRSQRGITNTNRLQKHQFSLLAMKDCLSASLYTHTPKSTKRLYPDFKQAHQRAHIAYLELLVKNNILKSTIWRKMLVVVTVVVVVAIVVAIFVIVTSIGIVIVVRLVARVKDMKNGMRVSLFWPADHPP